MAKAASVNLLLTVPSWLQMYSAAAVALGPSREERSAAEQVRAADMLTEFRKRETCEERPSPVFLLKGGRWVYG